MKKLISRKRPETVSISDYIVNIIINCASGLPRLGLTMLSFGVGKVCRTVNKTGRPVIVTSHGTDTSVIIPIGMLPDPQEFLSHKKNNKKRGSGCDDNGNCKQQDTIDLEAIKRGARGFQGMSYLDFML